MGMITQTISNILYRPSLKVYEAKITREGLHPTFLGYTESDFGKLPFAIGQTDRELEDLNDGFFGGIFFLGRLRALAKGEISSERIKMLSQHVKRDTSELARLLISQGLINLVRNGLNEENRTNISREDSALRVIYKDSVLFEGERVYGQKGVTYSGKLLGADLDSESGWKKVEDGSFIMFSPDTGLLSRIPL